MEKKKSVFIVFGILVCLNILAWIAVCELSQPRLLEVNFFDIGQGDAIFIQTPQRHQILIDGGPGSTILEKLAKEMPFWDREVDLIILTHPESDHLAGLIEVLKKYEVENILWTGVLRDTAEFREWEELIKNEGSQIFIAKAGQKIKLGESNLDILYPFENLAGENIKDINNTSVISRLTFGENSFIFTGDAYKSIEEKLIESKADIDSDVLKVGHHGSKTSTDEDFIKEVSPEIAVISCGKNNPYGHPHQGVLDVLAKYDITVLRTDKEGDIKILSDGKSLKIKN